MGWWIGAGRSLVEVGCMVVGWEGLDGKDVLADSRRRPRLLDNMTRRSSCWSDHSCWVCDADGSA
jgi:hypothetical protein